MPRLTLRRTAFALAFAAPLVFGGFMLGRVQSDTGLRVFQAVFQIVGREALDSLTTDSIYQNAARGVVAGLDDQYADLFSPAEYARFNRNQLRNRYGGVGLRITPSSDYVRVYRVIEGGPAGAAGVERGDKIAAVDDSSAQGWTTDRVSNALTGTPNTQVRLTVEKRDGTRRTYDLTRAVISLPAVDFTTMLNGNIGYIPLRNFSDRSARDVSQALRTLQGQGATSFILDLRGNPGGSLEQAVSLTSVFLDPGQPVVRVKSRREDDTLRAPGPSVVGAGVPVAVLIDGGSASASEIVAGALQDYDRALLVGTTSFGKGLVQGGYPLPEGWVLKLTTAHWYTPIGRLIQKTREDSARADSLRPPFRSAGGRTIFGGGGIVPDLIVGADTFTVGDIALARILNARGPLRDDVLDGYVRELEPIAISGYTYRPQWSDTLLSRLRTAGFDIPNPIAQAGMGYIERLLDTRLSSYALTDLQVFLRGAPDDQQLQQAADRLRRAHTQRELLAMAAARR